MAHYKGAASEAGRAMQLMKKREQSQQEMELRKKKLEDELKVSNMENKFATHYDAVEQQLKVNNLFFLCPIEMNCALCIIELDHWSRYPGRDEGQAGGHRQSERNENGPEAGRERKRTRATAGG